ncbi:alginate O-acetyltransferase AlgX-related protein [Ancylobacter sp.]|uniref:alginate O-acetyltransferase AlgX-related protein n=1 Tax=Ancylobacter sp. TaxID=1872567 RepID=UPI003D145960
MPLLMAFRRWWALLFVAILSLPTLGLIVPDMPAPMRTVLEPEARWWEHASQRLDPYINNAFGFRGAVLAAHQSYLRFIDAPQGERVLQGEGGVLFIRDNNALEQSIGQLVRPKMVAAFIDFATSLDAQETALGGRFVLLIPPNAHTVNFDQLPAYARRQKKAPTEYDLIAAGLAAEGTPFVDLRPLLAAASKDGRTYFRYDTHWNERAALVAFNAAMTAAGRPDLAVSPEQALGPRVVKPGGDLLRLGGLDQRDPPDERYQWNPAFAAPQGLKPLDGMITGNENPLFPTEAVETGHAGPRIMVMGDSFTRSFWRGLLAAQSSAFLWTHHQSCQLDRGLIDRFKPDILIYAPTERFLPCSNHPLRVELP